MNKRLRLVLVLHAHQPVGNLDAVSESIYRECYEPLLETLACYPKLPVNLHLSGSLVDWLAARHPEYLDRVRHSIAAGSVEILGGAYHDPILPMLPRADRRGQIESFGRRLGQLFGHVPRGMWLPERIWEPSLAADLADCGIEHTVLDDFHFHAAGLANEQLRGYWLTESEGRLVALFAGDERLRYLIPFARPEDTLTYLREVAVANPGGVVVYADDAEKFGAWPGMRERIENERWLHRFFDALTAAADWLEVTTLGQAIDHVAPLGKVYVPEGSYREMHDWSTLAKVDVTHSAKSPAAGLPGSSAGVSEGIGTWRNFRVKYPEADEMYCRMLAVSRRCAAATAASDADGAADDGLERDAENAPHPALSQRERGSSAAATGEIEAENRLIERARQALYRAQCGCAYWHGVFGGVYLPHLRQAVYRNLIEAERLLDAAAGPVVPRLSIAIDDFNLDVHKEILLTSETLSLLVAPERGGQIYELDARQAGTNLLATFTRRAEHYHQPAGSVNSPDRHLYDAYPRKSLLDHFYSPGATLDEVAAGVAIEQGDFMGARYRARLRRIRDGICLRLSRAGTALGQPLTVNKQLTLWADRPTVDIHYELAGLPPGKPYHFAVEFNFAGLPPACPDRYFLDAQGRILADLGEQLDLTRATTLRLVDRWAGLDVGLASSAPGGMWAYPVKTVSRSQRGLEAIQQSVAVLPHWTVVGDSGGRWSVDLQLAIVTSSTGAGKSNASSVAGTETTVAATAVKSGQFVVDGPHAQLAPLGIAGQKTRRLPA